MSQTDLCNVEQLWQFCTDFFQINVFHPH
jgi:hypothetical protein